MQGLNVNCTFGCSKNKLKNKKGNKKERNKLMTSDEGKRKEKRESLPVFDSSTTFRKVSLRKHIRDEGCDE